MAAEFNFTDEVPDCILLEIFQYLDLHELCLAARKACQRWHNLTFDPSLWKQLDLSKTHWYITDEDFIQLLSTVSSHIIHLNIQACDHLTASSLISDSFSCQKLSRITINNETLSYNRSYFELTSKPHAPITQLLLKYPSICEIFGDIPPVQLNHGEMSQLQIVMLQLDDSASLLMVTNIIRRNFNLRRVFITSYDETFLDSNIFEVLSDRDLVQLQLYNVRFDDHDLIKCVTMVKCLCDLDLSGTLVKDQTIITISRNCGTRLEKFNLSGCNHVTDVGYVSIGDYCPCLKQLVINSDDHVSAYGNITDVALAHIANYCRQLRCIELCNCPSISDQGLISVAMSCPLEKLVIAKCLQITNTAVLAIADNCPQLSSFLAAECVQLTSYGISTLLLSCRQLVELNLQTCHYLKKLNLQNFCHCGNIDIFTCAHEDSMHNNIINEEKASTVGNIDVVYGRENFDQPDLSSTCCGGTFMHIAKNGHKIKTSADNNNIKTTEQNSTNDVDGNEVHPITTTITNCMFCQSTLRILDLRLCSKIANDSLRQIIEFCGRIQELNIAGCYRVTDLGITLLAEKLPLLEVLDISCISAVKSSTLTDRSFLAIAQNCRSLKYLECVFKRSLNNISIVGLEAVLRKCPKLTSVFTRESINNWERISSVLTETRGAFYCERRRQTSETFPRWAMKTSSPLKVSFVPLNKVNLWKC